MINFTLQGLDSSPEQVALRLSSSEIKPPLIMSSKVGDLKKKCVLLKMPELFLRLILCYRDLTLHKTGGTAIVIFWLCLFFPK